MTPARLREWTWTYDDFDVSDGTYELPAGEKAPPVTLRVWTADDQQWACVAADHGPICRRCKPLDALQAALVSNAIEGVMEIWAVAGGSDWMVWPNAAGKARAETAMRRGGFDMGLDS